MIASYVAVAIGSRRTNLSDDRRWRRCARGRDSHSASAATAQGVSANTRAPSSPLSLLSASSERRRLRAASSRLKLHASRPNLQPRRRNANGNGLPRREGQGSLAGVAEAQGVLRPLGVTNIRTFVDPENPTR